MEIYVESRTEKRDYYWIAKREGLSTVEEVPDLPIFKTYSRSSLIDTKEFSVVLFREQGQLLLLITGLLTKRKDSQNRHISNSIAWIGTDVDEAILREIAALALNNNLQISQNVVVELSNSDFEVNWKVIEQLILSSRATSTSPEVYSKIARISDQRKQELATELMKYSLPSGDSALVAVTEGYITHKYYETVRIWRGLSDDPEASNEWVVLTPSSSVNSPGSNRKTLPIVIVVGILIILAFFVYLFANLIDISVIGRFGLNPTPTATNLLALCPGKKLPQLYSEKTKQSVRELQTILNKLPPKFQQEKQNNLSSDKFDENTKKAVEYFQTAYNKKLDKKQQKDIFGGTVATPTWEALWEITNNNEELKAVWNDICTNAKAK
ncbi:peptidoglycan-binding domain-containing protein [Nostoc sp.]|uniref:peptidoglycan-binding domain-containing protein n=1 Tax=Nostoc sp. TaxID=1180 RepID=UPI002FFCD5FA